MITINAGQSTSFPRIADAIEAAKAYAPMPVTIHIAPGRYHEKLTVSQPHVTLMGDDASNTILTYDDYAREIMPDGIKRGTFRTYTLFLDAPDITLCNLTAENAAGAGKEVGQAIALYAEGEGIRVENCRFIGSEPNTCYLGRPWREYAKVVILNSEIGDHIKPEGWHDWGKIDAHDTVYFAEYKNYGPGAAGARPSWTHTLTDTEAENYTYASVFN